MMNFKSEVDRINHLQLTTKHALFKMYPIMSVGTKKKNGLLEKAELKSAQLW